MLQLSNSLINRPVLSLRTGAMVGRAVAPFINPDNLKILGFYVEDRYNKKNLILLWQDVRDTLPTGYVINDHDVLAEPEELVRYKKILGYAYTPIGKQVVTLSKEKVGKVTDYATDTTSMYIQKLYVSRSILKSLTGGNLSIDRTQINEITPKKIIINELLNQGRVPAPAAAPNLL